MASLPVYSSHEGFVTPSSYLRRPRGHSKPMPPAEPLSAVERDQRLGLVSETAAAAAACGGAADNASPVKPCQPSNADIIGQSRSKEFEIS